ncbi:glycosyl hydrolase family 28 protein [Clostridium cibarium]|uniref:Glycoside hydrolase family 28 protein n=1 Tax=Clostridium cibarium TaxID=2762247 RepID=A0ABR8PUC4_9CLOT|nr:glycoside hydrolase family 28 protein [Clostridium cibarium]MBD7911723.1 glycoside hydrolase family 28 protein [Clostridium cibarium]
MKKYKLTSRIIIFPILICLILFFYFPKSQKNSEESLILSSCDNLIVPTLAYDDNSITLAWHKQTNSSDIVDYNIYMDGNLIGNANNSSEFKAKSLIEKFYNDPSNSSAVNISSHSFKVSGLTPDTSYSFIVKAVDNKGNEIAESNKVIQSTEKPSKIFNSLDYGAAGDGKTLDTKAIQSAIDACTPGGQVLLPSGKTFKSGSLLLKGNITFKVDGTLLGSGNPEDYLKNNNSRDKLANYSLLYINANNKEENLKIIGTGTIDGNGWRQAAFENEYGFPNSLKSSLKTVEENGILAANQFKLCKTNGLSETDAYSRRSNLISIRNMKNIYFGDGLSFINPSRHTISLSNCNDVVLNNALIKTFDCNNGDGIDFNGKGLTVLNSVFDTGDDDINFNAGKGDDGEESSTPVDNAWIFNNYFGRGHGAVVAGSYTAAWIQNILAEDNVLNGTGSGLRCKSSARIGGGAKNIVFRDSALKNIVDGEGKPFIFTSNYSDSNSAGSFKPAKTFPQFKHILVSNCSVDTSKDSSILVAGLKDSYHEDIYFKNISFKGTKPAKITYMKDSTFKNVTFDSNIKDPWDITNCKTLDFDND